MKRLLIILALVLLPSLSLAGVQDTLKGMIARKNSASVCATYASNATGTSALAVADGTGTYYRGWVGQLAANKCVCKVVFKMTKQAGDISAITYTARIWSLSGNNLDAELGASAGVMGSNSWSNTEVSYTFSSCVNLAASTSYAITLDTGTSSGTNYAVVFANTSDNIANWGYNRWTAAKASQSLSANDIVVNLWVQ